MKDTPGISDLKQHIIACHSLYKEFFWLIDSYVLDFFTDNHWEKLRESWKTFLCDIQPEHLANILDVNSEFAMSKVAPLSMIALRIVVQNYSFPRRNFICGVKSNTKGISAIKKRLVLYEDLHRESKILKLFWKHVKPKKRHEINIMAEETFERACESDCKYIIDIGSGLGHLARLLAYGYNLNICGIELQEKLTTLAMQLDSKFETMAIKYYSDFQTFKKKPVHVNMKIEPGINPKEFQQLIRSIFHIEERNFKFGIVGLHPCGDLGATLLRLFKDCDNCQFINIVGCCYMKLTANGFPMSSFFKENNFTLSYNSREIACHHLDMYLERLKMGNHWELKIHAYRAIIEKLIAKKWPYMIHSPLANVKYTKELTFPSYCKKALKKFDISLENLHTQTQEIEDNLNDWLKVVVYYTLRLQIAPLIETIILLDRLLYINESDGVYLIKSAFDPKLSPRNFIVTAIKRIKKL